MINITDGNSGAGSFNAIAAGTEKNLVFTYSSTNGSGWAYRTYVTSGDIAVVDKPFKITREGLENARLISNYPDYKSTGLNGKVPKTTKKLLAIRNNSVVAEFPFMFTGDSPIAPPTTSVSLEVEPVENGGVLLAPGEGYELRSELIDSLGTTGVGVSKNAGFTDYDVIDVVGLVFLQASNPGSLRWWDLRSNDDNWLTSGREVDLDIAIHSAESGNGYESYVKSIKLIGNYTNFKNIDGENVLLPATGTSAAASPSWGSRIMEICIGTLTPDGNMIVLSNVTTVEYGRALRGGISQYSYAGDHQSFPGNGFSYIANDDITLRVPSILFYRELGRTKWSMRYSRSYSTGLVWSYATAVAYSTYIAGYETDLTEVSSVNLLKAPYGWPTLSLLNYSTQVEEYVRTQTTGGDFIPQLTLVDGIKNARQRSTPAKYTIAMAGMSMHSQPVQFGNTITYPLTYLWNKGYTKAEVSNQTHTPLDTIQLNTDPATWATPVTMKGPQLPLYHKLTMSVTQDSRAAGYKVYGRKTKFYGPKTEAPWDLLLNNPTLSSSTWNSQVITSNVTLPNTNTTRAYVGNYYGQFVIPDDFTEITLNIGDALINAPVEANYIGNSFDSTAWHTAEQNGRTEHRITVSIPAEFV